MLADSVLTSRLQLTHVSLGGATVGLHFGRFLHVFTELIEGLLVGVLTQRRV